MDGSVCVDVHTHLIPREMVEALGAADREYGPRFERDAEGAESLVVRGGRIGQITDRLCSVDVAVAEAAERGVDRVLLSVPPFMLLYGAPPEVGVRFAEIQNNILAHAVKAWPGRADAMAVLPMQAPVEAATELRWAVRQLGLKGAIIGTNVGGRDLDAPELEPVWAEAEALGVALFIHPHTVLGERMGAYHLRNLVGNPLDITLAAVRLIAGGVAERHPRLRFLLANGGGYLLLALGRLDHGYAVRPELHEAIPRPPADYLGQFWVDTILHDTRALRYAVSIMGEGRVLLGSDEPFDMGDPEAVARVVNATWLSDAARQRILGGNALELFGLDHA